MASCRAISPERRPACLLAVLVASVRRRLFELFEYFFLDLCPEHGLAICVEGDQGYKSKDKGKLTPDSFSAFRATGMKMHHY